MSMFVPRPGHFKGFVMLVVYLCWQFRLIGKKSELMRACVQDALMHIIVVVESRDEDLMSLSLQVATF